MVFCGFLGFSKGFLWFSKGFLFLGSLVQYFWNTFCLCVLVVFGVVFSLMVLLGAFWKRFLVFLF